MQLNPTMEKFYLSIIDYAGMKVENGIFVNKNEKIGELTIDGRHLTLPYFDNLKNPENRLIFHPLNESYTSPETTVFNLFKRRLVLELNLRLSALMVSLVGVAGDVSLQQRIKSSKLIELVSSIGSVEIALVEGLLAATTASKKVNGEAFLFDIFLKKNGEINDTPYAAIGKVNFLMFTEIQRALKDGDYKLFGKKLTKKELLPMDNLFRVVFPAIEDPSSYTEGTDNKVFRYLNILLKTSYQIGSRINEIVAMLEELNEPALNLEEIRCNLDWAGYLEELYGMAAEIRIIPSQTDMIVEANKMKLDESKASAAAPASAPSFDPSRAQQPVQQVQQTMQQPQQVQQPQMMQQPQQPQAPLSPEDIIRGSMGQPGMMPGMMPMMQPGMMMPGMMPGMIPGQPMMQPQIQTPQWVLQEQMKAAGQMPQQQMPMMQPGMMQTVAPGMQMPMQMMPQQMQPQMMPQQVMQQQPQIINTPQGPMIMTPQGMVPAQMMGQPMMQPGMMMQQQPVQQGLAVNPHFMQRSAAPFN